MSMTVSAVSALTQLGAVSFPPLGGATDPRSHLLPLAVQISCIEAALIANETQLTSGSRDKSDVELTLRRFLLVATSVSSPLISETHHTPVLFSAPLLRHREMKFE